ncbi:hypothetical protein CMUS01_12668 [Colletotrichum musicola]|uniref:Uncharacterized protein n=1 Tax=Colletotrichum musicola TaxID=2175873 RepID=A0A8H6JKK1_9PEZI|nr:hypothetical protein CMUS01_12668 [Colletotrichum musicola]
MKMKFGALRKILRAWSKAEDISGPVLFFLFGIHYSDRDHPGDITAAQKFDRRDRQRSRQPGGSEVFSKLHAIAKISDVVRVRESRVGRVNSACGMKPLVVSTKAFGVRMVCSGSWVRASIQASKSGIGPGKIAGLGTSGLRAPRPVATQ